ncbi:MAG: glycosyltransferase [Terriglobus sp.]
MKLVIYGLTVTSSWGNGHATTFRSLLRALHMRGHHIRFIEKDVEWYRNHRDLPKPDFCSVHLYRDWELEEESLVSEARDADAIIIGSYFPDAIRATEALLTINAGPLMFYDIDTPVTMAALRKHGRCDYLEARLIPHYTTYLSFTGGPTLRELEESFGSPHAVPLYCSVDSERYRPVASRSEFRCAMSYLGTHATDRQPKLMQMLNDTARELPEETFIVAGPMYPQDTPWAANVGRMDHVAPPDHPAFYASAHFTLNLTRRDMVEAGYSPSVRLFEASACGAAILSDAWPGMEEFLTPGEEILLPGTMDEVVRIIRDLSDEERIRMGRRARERILAEHTSVHRAQELEAAVASCTALR